VEYGPQGCQWTDEDGPDQCDPNEAPPAISRYKTDGMHCWWEANDSGPNQCDPNVPSGEPLQADENTVPQFEVGLSDGEGEQSAARHSGGEPVGTAVRGCRAYTK
jgi:hypothetical protein